MVVVLVLSTALGFIVRGGRTFKMAYDLRQILHNQQGLPRRARDHSAFAAANLGASTICTYALFVFGYAVYKANFQNHFPRDSK